MTADGDFRIFLLFITDDNLNRKCNRIFDENL